jgi:lipoprotein-anchoring transpeptidase ErfK/SrfK
MPHRKSSLVLFRVFIMMVLVAGMSLPAAAKRKGGKSHASPAPAQKRSEADIEAATRLQVFLDRANFSPGKIDGHYNGFTFKALTLYRQSRGEPPPAAPPKPDTAPDLNGIDLESVGPAFIQYTVTDADLQNTGRLPTSVPEKAKLKALPYGDAGEAIAEKFHCDPKFLGELNPGKKAALKPGDQVRVPNVEPFELSAVKDLKAGSEVAPQATPLVANDISDEPDTPQPDASGEPAVAVTSVKVDVKTNMLGVFDGDKIIAAYPVTVGSAQTVTPVGEWKVKGVAKLPTFRYDQQMLKHGERGRKFHMLPPGPNSPVGVVWIALNKRGIGIHGTDDPNTIGQAASHGCIRLANWDVVRLAERVKAGVAVSVQ